MVKFTGETGGTTVERKVFFKKENHDYQQISVTVFCDGVATPNEVKQITEIVERAKDEIKKVVEE